MSFADRIDKHNTLRQQNMWLSLENERLRDALEEIKQRADMTDEYAMECYRIADLAEAALKG